MNAPSTLPLPIPTDDAPAPPAPQEPGRRGGPRTEEGKDRSRRNALTEGFRARTVLPEAMAQAVEARAASLRPIFRPANEHEDWLVGQVALAEVRLDRCLALELAELQAATARAELAWDADRRADAAALGSTLPRDPARVAAALRATRHGAHWMIDRWGGLATALDRPGGWDDDQRALALDLLGVPTALRDHTPALPHPADAEALRALVERELAGLDAALSEALEDLDALDRDRAASGLAADTPALRRLRRYEAGFRRTLAWALAQLHGQRQSRGPSAPAPEPPPSWQSLEPPPRRVAAPTVPEPAAESGAEAESAPGSGPDPAPGNRRARRRLAKLARQADRRPHRAGPRDR
jgi:hypothetical protein